MTTINVISSTYEGYNVDAFGKELKTATVFFKGVKNRNYSFTVGNENNFLGWNEHKETPEVKYQIEETYGILGGAGDKREFLQLPLCLNTEFGVFKIDEKMNVQ